MGLKVSGFTALAVLLCLVCTTGVARAGDACLTGDGSLLDPAQVAIARSTVDAMCPCDAYDGSPGNNRSAYQKCARSVADTLVADGLLRSECRTLLRKAAANTVCGRDPDDDAAPCIRRSASGSVSCTIKAPSDRCEDRTGIATQTACPGVDDCLDAADTNHDLLIDGDDDGRCSGAATPTPAPAFTPTPTPAAVPTPVPTAAAQVALPYPTGSNGTRLAELVNEYRLAHGKKAIPVTPTMMAVAGAHVYDLVANPQILSATCNLHSWSNTSGLWSGCCYDAYGTQASCMWSKPAEIGGGIGWARYTGRGFEVTYRGWFATPEMVIDFFDASAPHKAVLLNQGTWASYDPFPAMGAAMRGDFAVIWFGSSPDPVR